MSPSKAQPAAADDADDPVEKEYDVYITPPLDAATRLYLLQYPTRDRDQAYNAFNETTPLELRLKASTGFVELDVPILTNANYNAPKARQWGAALDQTKMDGGFGIASGLAVAPPPRSQARGGRRATSDVEMSEAADGQRDTSMRHQTLGGQILTRERGAPTYMIGAFEGDKLHLTPLSGLVQMRPQFHHLDAQTVSDRQSRARAAAEGPGGRLAKGADGVPPAPSTKAVLSTTKVASTDNEDSSATNTKQLLEQAQAESWTRLKYYDEEDQEAYDAYAERLFLPGTHDAAGVTQLVSTMSNDEYLDAISAPRNDPHGKVRAAKQARAKRARETVEVSDESGSDQVAVEEDEGDDDDEDNADNGDDNDNDDDDTDEVMADAVDEQAAADRAATASELRRAGN